MMCQHDKTTYYQLITIISQGWFTDWRLELRRVSQHIKYIDNRSKLFISGIEDHAQSCCYLAGMGQSIGNVNI
jgi:hypothetical protein